MQSDVPKPFIKIGNLRILSLTLQCFDQPELVDEIIIPVSSDWINEAKLAVQEASINVPVKFVEGGSERMYSIYNGLSVVSENSDYVAVHDAVRPFASAELLSALVDAAVVHKAAIPGVPVTDTIKEIDETGKILRSPDRSRLMAAQTPQVFEKGLLFAAYKHAIQTGFTGTDDASLVEHFGATVMLIPGEGHNFKVTFKDDLLRAENFLKQG